MGQRRTLNQKRLTKKEVQEIIRTEGRLHDEYTKFFEETYVTGYVKQDKVYELPPQANARVSRGFYLH